MGRGTPNQYFHPQIFNFHDTIVGNQLKDESKCSTSHNELNSAKDYTLYKYKLKGLESEFYHFDFMIILNLFSRVYF